MSATTAVRDRPILFSGEMVRAILDGRKTQTRRVCKVQPTTAHGLTEKPTRWVGNDGRLWFLGTVERDWWFGRCPFGEPGDRLWVRETWAPRSGELPLSKVQRPFYRATDGEGDTRNPWRWRPSIFMPRWASRITLEVVSVRVERLQAIDELDANAEGMSVPPEPFPIFGMGGGTHAEARAQDEWRAKYRHWRREEFQFLWNELNAKRGYGWDVDPWVWVIEFRRVEA